VIGARMSDEADLKYFVIDLQEYASVTLPKLLLPKQLNLGN
jgi:hypothetical protein